MFAVLIGLAAAAILLLVGELPLRAASRFGFGGAPNSYLSREAMTGILLLVGAVLPALIGFGLPMLIARLPRLANVPNRDHWFSGERVAGSLTTFERAMQWLALLMAGFTVAMSGLLVHANRQIPPRLDSGAFALLVGAFVAASIFWTIRLRRSFPTPGTHAASET